MNGFDKLAKPYRWMEYISFGSMLERCRFTFLPALQSTQTALLMGDGDGRFTAHLLQTSPNVRALAVDASPAMLRALRHRCNDSPRLETLCCDLRNGLPQQAKEKQFDLIATHFFLDCLTANEVERIASDTATITTANARWLVSEFNIPDNGTMHLLSRIVIRLLYAAFHLLTGLNTQHLPSYREILRHHGWQMEQSKTHLRGLLVSELWTHSAHTMDTAFLAQE